MFQLFSYIKFLLNSTNRHGVHSPFVFNLVEECFNTKTNKKLTLQWNVFNHYLKSSRKKISVIDFGAGSKVFTSNTRKVKQIAKIAGISKKRAQLLIRLTSYFKPLNILEIGTSLGLSTYAIHLGNPQAKITSLEGCKNTAQIPIDYFNEYAFNNINIIVGDFKNTIKSVTSNNLYDFIFFDGNHTKQATLNYFETALNCIHNDTVFVFDDIHWSLEMEQAWETIKEHPKVTVTIDTFQWGFVFFRKEQAKEHFIIRV